MRQDVLAACALIVAGTLGTAMPRHSSSSAGGAVEPKLGAAQECAMTGTLADGDAKRGEPLYAKQCAKCHGADGDGKGKVVKRLTKAPNPWNSKAAWDKTTDKVKFQSTRCGGKFVGKSDDMPDYPELTDQQIWDLLSYARTFQQAQKRTAP